MVWHLDGYDKLKPCDFEIHDCIYGYSRPVLWLSVIRSNKDPKKVCNLYFSYLFIAKEVPRTIVADQGTENVNIAGFQTFLRQNHSGDSSGYRSFQFGKSIANQRIESFWSQLRRSFTGWWIRFFKEIMHEGIYDNTDYLQTECFKFCFFTLIQKELNDIKDYWNNYPICRSVLSDRESRPAGRPDVIYFVRDCSSEYLLKYDNQNIFLVGEESCPDKKNTPYICSYAFYELAVLLMDEYGLPEAG